MLYFPPEEKSDSLAQSATVVCAYMLLVVGVVSSIYVMRFSLQGQIGTLAAVLASVINTVQIVVFNFIYRSVVIKLTDHENPRTDTIYEDSMIVKLFVFQFVNSYASFFFIAFIAGYLTTQDAADDDAKGQCGATTCMEPLSINLAIIFGTRLTLTNFLDIFLPYVAYKQKVKKETEGVEDPTSLTPAEQDYMVGNYFKAKLNLWKLVTFYQRPVPTGAQVLNPITTCNYVCIRVLNPIYALGSTSDPCPPAHRC
ncbi:calcium-activated chloride channel-domain-containing protein [Ochromonadaceae sp. CCMP2298]|nr:calcium-activated chloride channel-domain-containing protein [Ochromonadaceae sp. CCMP2298]